MKKIVMLILVASLGNVAYAAEKPKNDSAQFDQMFNAVDTDHDGKISKPEADLKAPAMGEAFEHIDTDHDGYLSKAEIKAFTAHLIKEKEQFNQQLVAADKDKNGKWSREESKAIPLLDQNFTAIDSNHDGQLTHAEISEFLRAQIKAANARAK
jgi:Ca2+-binding EF-hand superfamily protein